MGHVTSAGQLVLMELVLGAGPACAQGRLGPRVPRQGAPLATVIG